MCGMLPQRNMPWLQNCLAVISEILENCAGAAGSVGGGGRLDQIFLQLLVRKDILNCAFDCIGTGLLACRAEVPSFKSNSLKFSPANWSAVKTYLSSLIPRSHEIFFRLKWRRSVSSASAYTLYKLQYSLSHMHNWQRMLTSMSQPSAHARNVHTL